MKILGIDPGFATIGLGVIESVNSQTSALVDYCCITTPSTMQFEDRLQEISSDLLQYVKQHQPELCVIEELFFTTNKTTAINVAQARGVILHTVHSQNIPIIGAAPRGLKTALTGDGNADKKQMQEMIKMILSLDEIPKPDDAADALGLAIYGSIVGQSPLLH